MRSPQSKLSAGPELHVLMDLCGFSRIERDVTPSALLTSALMFAVAERHSQTVGVRCLIGVSAESARL